MLTAKVMLLGEMGVGKTSIMYRLVHDRFEGQYKTTLGVEILSYDVTSTDGREPMRLVLWDTDGDFGTQIFDTVYVTGASAAIIVADITRPQTVSRMIELIPRLRDEISGAALQGAGEQDRSPGSRGKRRTHRRAATVERQAREREDQRGDRRKLCRTGRNSPPAAVLRHGGIATETIAMTYEEYNAFCGALPATSYVVQWGGSHVWKVGGKVFAIGGWHDGEPSFTFKVSDIAYEMLRGQPGPRPAPYLASRGLKWIAAYA